MEANTESMDKEVEVPETPKEEKVEVRKEGLEALMKDVEDLKLKNTQLENRLIAVADKDRMNRYDQQNAQPKPKFVRLTTFDGQVILGWKMLVDEVYKNHQGVWVEKQMIKLFLEDGSDTEVTYMDFVKKAQKINASIQTRTTDSDGNETMVVTSDAGKEYKIGVQFVN